MNEKERFLYINDIDFFNSFNLRLDEYYGIHEMDMTPMGGDNFFFIHEKKIKREDHVNIQFSIHVSLPEDENETKVVHIEAKIENDILFDYLIPLTEYDRGVDISSLITDENTMGRLARERKILIMDLDDYVQKLNNIYDSIKGYVRSGSNNLNTNFINALYFLTNLQVQLQHQCVISSEIMVSKGGIRKGFEVNFKDEENGKTIEGTRFNFSEHSEYGGIDLEVIHLLSFDEYISIRLEEYSREYYGQDVENADLHGIIKYQRKEGNIEKKPSVEEFINELKPYLNDALEEINYRFPYPVEGGGRGM